MLTKTLILVHVATRRGIMPDGTPWEYPLEGYDDMAIGNATTLGRIFHALYIAQFAKQAKLYITLPPDELPHLDDEDFCHLVKRASLRLIQHKFKLQFNFPEFDQSLALSMLKNAYVDTWSDVAETGDPVNTVGEVKRATRYALEHGFQLIQPVSTGSAHAPRCGLTAFNLSQADGLVVPGYASSTFEGLEGETSTIIDPVHLKEAAFGQVPKAHQLHKLVATIFKVAFGKKTYAEQVAVFRSVTTLLVGWLKANGQTTNAKGEDL